MKYSADRTYTIEEYERLEKDSELARNDTGELCYELAHHIIKNVKIRDETIGNEVKVSASIYVFTEHEMSDILQQVKLVQCSADTPTPTCNTLRYIHQMLTK